MAKAPKPADEPIAGPARNSFRPVAELAPYARNARTHSAKQVVQLAQSIDEWGWTNDVAADAEGIIAGHGRVLAAQLIYKDGRTIYLAPGAARGGQPVPAGMVPVVDVSGWSVDQRAAYILADNRLAEQADWNPTILRDELAALGKTGFDLSLAGFDTDFLASLNAPPKGGQSGAGNMAREFLIPPFSVLNAREGWWGERKREWLALGIKSELGRGGAAAPAIPGANGGDTNIAFKDPNQYYTNRVGAKASPGGSPRPAADYSPGRGHDEQRGDGAGKPMTHAEADRAARLATPGGGGPNSVMRQGSKRYSEKTAARAFGQDLLDNEHAGIALQRGVRRSTGAEPVEGQPGQPNARPGGLGGVTMTSLSSHPRYYEQKTAAEAKVGHKLTPEEFERDHWVEPDSEIISGTSIFDPVLTELAYRWFSPAGGVILDPFAGGSVRGVVAGVLGRQYVGIDLRGEQIAANRAQAAAIVNVEGMPLPVWHEGDSLAVLPGLDVEADMVFSCPPYGDLEVYSDDPLDISTLAHPAFVESYRAIIAAAVARLKADRFACFVVGDYRDKAGLYRDFVSTTIRAFADAGAALYNEAILVTSVGSLPIRAAKQFRSTRKLGKTHQNVLVFIKGDPRRATEACGPVDVSGSLEGVGVDANDD